MKNYSIPIIFLLFIFDSTKELHAQSIEKHYDFVIKNDWSELFITDDISVGVEFRPKKARVKRRYLYCLINRQKIDSLLLPEESGLGSLVTGNIISSGNAIHFCLSRPERLLSVNRKTGKFSTPIIFNEDSLRIQGVVNNYFVARSKRYLVRLYDPKNQKAKNIYDYAISVDELYKDDIGTEHPVGIGDIFSFTHGNKILIKTGYNESDGSFACIYYIVDATTGITEKLDFSHFEPLLVEPRDKLNKVQQVRFDSTSVDVREVYFDVTDSVGYIPYKFPYDSTESKSLIRSKQYKQDAFVVNRDFKLIGRSLERAVNTAYPIYNKGLKSWNVIYSNTDSLKRCFFKIKLNYSLEKTFYDIYYNKSISESRLKAFDKYELSLLRNFIFAKHNYKFDSPFYQAYFNTFVFYGDEAKRKSRREHVDDLLTDADKASLSLIKTQSEKRK